MSSEQGLPAHLRGAVVALGNFDGFHRGHQAVVGRAIERAHAQDRPAIVATFDPHPKRLFQPDAQPFRLTTLDQRQRLFASAGADAMLVLQFTPAFSLLSVSDFVSLLAVDLGVAGVVTGADFTFGKGRSGGVDTLRIAGAPLGLRAETVAEVEDAEVGVISSSRIRQALAAGDCAAATRLLSRPFAIESAVVRHERVRSDSALSVARLRLGAYLQPADGIYLAQIRLRDGRLSRGVVKFDTCHVLGGSGAMLDCGFPFDRSGDLRGQSMEIALIKRLCGAQHFANFSALLSSMAMHGACDATQWEDYVPLCDCMLAEPASTLGR
ncbi:riboflavin kinase [Methylorubrum thiocyanatum]|uniref:riboflavin kinase n=1 Tax=Methylorubrum thiocyanatum TaxID=47958 RepID=UPI00383AA35D